MLLALNLFASLFLFDIEILTYVFMLLFMLCCVYVCVKEAQTLCSLVHRVSSQPSIKPFETESFSLLSK